MWSKAKWTIFITSPPNASTSVNKSGHLLHSHLTSLCPPFTNNLTLDRADYRGHRADHTGQSMVKYWRPPEPSNKKSWQILLMLQGRGDIEGSPWWRARGGRMEHITLICNKVSRYRSVGRICAVFFHIELIAARARALWILSSSKRCSQPDFPYYNTPYGVLKAMLHGENLKNGLGI